MAYGPNAGGVPFTGFSPTLGTADAVLPVGSGNVQLNGLSQADDRVSKLFRQRGNRVARRLMLSLFGVAPGVVATELMTRTAAKQLMNDASSGGGIVQVETVAQINRATTATDVSNLQQSISRTATLTMPVEPSGTTGGGKTGY